MRPGAENDVAVGQAGQLGDPQPGLDGEHEHGVITPAGPGAPVRCGQQGVDLWRGEPGEQCALVALGRDGQDPLDDGGAFGVVQCGVAEQRVDGGEAPVAGPDRVVPVSFQVVEEGGDQWRVQVGDVQRGGRLAGPGGGEADQQPERVPVTGDGVTRGPALSHEPLGEERLQHRRQRGHDSPAPCSSRAATSCISSGTADKYQYVFFGSTCPR